MRLPVSRARYDALAAQYERVIGERDDARAERDEARKAGGATARQFVAADASRQQLEEQVRELTRRLADATKPKPGEDDQECRRCEHLQQRLDQALGLDTPPVKAGQGEHTRRPTRMQWDPS